MVTSNKFASLLTSKDKSFATQFLASWNSMKEKTMDYTKEGKTFT